jgi:hypothetical protein
MIPLFVGDFFVPGARGIRNTMDVGRHRYMKPLCQGFVGQVVVERQGDSVVKKSPPFGGAKVGNLCYLELTLVVVLVVVWSQTAEISTRRHGANLAFPVRVVSSTFCLHAA